MNSQKLKLVYYEMNLIPMLVVDIGEQLYHFILKQFVMEMVIYGVCYFLLGCVC